ncbi:MAG: riboflavin biosynthesis protein RibF [Candidatus Omnitrophica bacterium]|nr:riboflavin biosynthesis protein RibF [Candidatus Omnitrophota bacterium]
MEKIHFRDIATFRGEFSAGIGKFDGVHLGHREILGMISSEAERTGGIPAVFTFRKFRAEFMLCGWEEKLALLEKAGIRICFWCDIDEIYGLSHRAFLDTMVSAGLKTLVVGYNFRFGAGRKGDVKFLQKKQKDKKFNLVIVPPRTSGGEIVNSSKIRTLIKKGEIAKANDFLGRTFSVTGKVISGSNTGSTIGFPTANLSLENNVRAGEGVYAGWAVYKDKIYKAAIVAGVPPSFRDKTEKFEVFMINFSGGEIYGEEVKVFLFKKLREQIKFRDKKKLKLRIAADVEEIKDLLVEEPCLMEAKS